MSDHSTDRTLITLAEIGKVLGVAYRTPYTWWKRTKSGEAEYPMPRPTHRRVRGEVLPGPSMDGFGLLWDADIIRAWYDDWKLP